MQGILEDAGVIQPRRKSVQDRYKNVPQLLKLRDSSTTRSLKDLRMRHDSEEKVPAKDTAAPSVKSQLTKVAKVKHAKKQPPISTTTHVTEENSKLTHRAMQTERQEDLSKLYDTGVIKYPSPGVLKGIKQTESPLVRPIQKGEGDQVDNLSQLMENNLTTEEKDFIKENRNIKSKQQKQSPVKVMMEAPPNYQRGVVPKYLRDRKQESPLNIDTDCPPGHILLPEEERKETLRVLRQSYADRIQELNMMPVRNDTLRMRKRKMEIEEELKRIDGGIKVFQRPKVFVKINA